VFAFFLHKDNSLSICVLEIIFVSAQRCKRIRSRPSWIQICFILRLLCFLERIFAGFVLLWSFSFLRMCRSRYIAIAIIIFFDFRRIEWPFSFKLLLLLLLPSPSHSYLSIRQIWKWICLYQQKIRDIGIRLIGCFLRQILCKNPLVSWVVLSSFRNIISISGILRLHIRTEYLLSLPLLFCWRLWNNWRLANRGRVQKSLIYEILIIIEVEFAQKRARSRWSCLICS